MGKKSFQISSFHPVNAIPKTACNQSKNNVTIDILDLILVLLFCKGDIIHGFCVIDLKAEIPEFGVLFR